MGGLAAMLVVAAAAGWLARRPIVAAALTAALNRVGAGEVKFTVAGVSPGRVEIDGLGFRLRTQAIAAARVTLERPQWWRPTLGRVRVEGVQAAWVIDDSDVNPAAWPAYPAGAAGPASFSVPADELIVDGVVAIRAATLPDQPLALHAEARQTAAGWTVTARLAGQGLTAAVEGTADPERRQLALRGGSVAVDLAAWQDYLQRAWLLPGGNWKLAGRLGGELTGGYDGRAWSVGGHVRLEAGEFGNEARHFAARGVEADIAFGNFLRLQSKTGTLRARELTSGDFVANDLDVALAFAGRDRIDVSRATLRALGGTLAAEPFSLAPSRDELEATMVADGLDVAAILARAGDVPAQAVGRVGGRLPIRIDQAGLRLGTGWLELKKGVRAEVQLKAVGLLTGGVPRSNPGYNLLTRVESGLLRLQMTELRLDVHPPDAPAGRTAQLHLAGEPIDPGVKMPITLDLKINGPLERVINLGLDRRVSFGAEK